MKFFYDNKSEKLIIKEATTREYNYLKNYLRKKIDGHEWNQKVKMRIWDGIIDHFNNGYIELGHWKRCYEICRTSRCEFDIINKKDFPLNNNIDKDHFVKFIHTFFKDRKNGSGEAFFPHEHQIEAAWKILKNRYCRIEVATSGGKSLIYAMILFYLLKYVKKDAKFLLVVPSILLVTQFFDDLVDYNLGYNKENKNPLDLRVLEIMSDHPRKYHGEGEPNIYIATYQSLDNDEVWKKEFFEQFYSVTVDECLDGETLISMADGSLMPIKNINIGDEVWTLNESTNEKEVREVEYVYENMTNSLSEDMYEIELENGKILKITGNHKVYLTSNIWKRADELIEGDDILYIK